MNDSRRVAEFAGKFYPNSKFEIEKLLDRILISEKNRIATKLATKNIIGAIVPHAGYIYSAYQAVHVYEIIKRSTSKFDTFVIINPNHTGQGSNDINISKALHWETPMGSIPVDMEFAKAMEIEFNDNAHLKEHSGEVQLPLLSHFIPYNFKIVMVTMNRQTPETAIQLAKSIQKAVDNTKRKIFLLASSDFSHFERPNVGFEKDQLIINEILNLNSIEIFKKVKKHSISACGYGPIMSLIEYAKQTTGTPKIELLRRGHSGEIHPSKQVVNYVSFLCFE